MWRRQSWCGHHRRDGLGIDNIHQQVDNHLVSLHKGIHHEALFAETIFAADVEKIGLVQDATYITVEIETFKRAVCIVKVLAIVLICSHQPKLFHDAIKVGSATRAGHWCIDNLHDQGHDVPLLL